MPAKKPKRRPPIWSVAGIIQWLRGKPAGGRYEYLDLENCLVCQYARARGVPVRSASSHHVILTDGSVVKFSARLADIAADDTPKIPGATYGAALKRARRFQRMKSA